MNEPEWCGAAIYKPGPGNRLEHDCVLEPEHEGSHRCGECGKEWPWSSQS